MQYGVTGGGNDGAVFSRYGSVDRPSRLAAAYSHFPAAVIDTRDLDPRKDFGLLLQLLGCMVCHPLPHTPAAAGGGPDESADSDADE